MRRLLAAATVAVASLGLAPVVDGSPSRPGLDDILVSLDATQTNGPGTFTDPASPNYAVPWGLDILDARTGTQDDSFTYANDGTGVNVYVLDTGIQADHPAFGGRVSAAGWSYRGDSTSLNSYKNSTSVPACPYDSDTQQFDPATYDKPASVVTSDKGTVDNNGHGTHVSGVVTGALTGVAKNVTLIPVRALDSCGNGTANMLYQALKWIRDTHTSEKAVLNMSIGLAYDPVLDPLEGVIRDLLAEGVVVVAAAGNSGTSACGTIPAGTTGTISVGAIGHDLTESRFSNYGTCVDIFAPGGQVETNSTAIAGRQILSTWPKSGASSLTYVEELGTSMATPHVTGAVAAWLQGESASTSNDENAWTWLKKNASCGLVTYVRSGVTQTPNRLLSMAAPAAPCAPTNVAVTQATGQSTVSWDEVPSANGSDITGYQVSTTPASTGCTTNASTFSCTLTGLSDGVEYSVSVKAVNGIGPGSAATKALIAGPTGTLTPTTTDAPTTTAAPTTTTTVPEPVAPDSASTTTTSSSSITISWPATAPAGTVTYVVTISPSGSTCTTTVTSCTFAGVTAGTNYTFFISVKNASGTVSGSSLKVTAVAGFTQSVKSVKVRSRTLLTRMVKTVSKGKRKYKVTSGKCRISTGRLVAPTKAGTCRVRVSVARSGKYKAFSTTITVAVTK